MRRIVIILVGHKTTGVEDNFLNVIFCRCGRDIIAQRCGIFAIKNKWQVRGDSVYATCRVNHRLSVVEIRLHSFDMGKLCALKSIGIAQGGDGRQARF